MKTKSRNAVHIVTLFSLLVMCASLFRASPAGAASGSFAWAKSMGGANQDFGGHIAVDSTGNVYTTGSFADTADFDPGAGTANLTSAGSYDLFISKLDSNGDFVWARGLGGINFEQSRDLAVDTGGNVYTIGYFYGTADFDPGAGTANLTSAGDTDLFISKLDSNGDFVWAKSIGGIFNDIGESIALDASGNVYTTGFFQHIVDFDPGASTYNLTDAGFGDIFVSKLDSSGRFIWAGNMGGVGHDAGLSLAVDPSGNVYTTGSFSATADFDPGAGTATPTSAGLLDIFVSKLDRDGNYVWAKSMGGANDDYTFGLALDPSGNVYTTGTFLGTADFDPGAGTASLTSAGNLDTFVSKLNSNGSFVWVRGMGGPNYDYSFDLALDPGGNVYTTGLFSGTVDFDPGAGMTSLTSVGSNDIFASKLDSNGSFAWAKIMGGAEDDESFGLALDAGGSVYTTGYFHGTADFDPGPGTASLTSAGSRDVFVVKLQEAPIFVDVPLGYWALDFIERLYGAGITGGCATSPLRYCPEDTVTRAQMAVFLLRGIHTSAYTPPAIGPGSGFGDVPVDYWSGAWIKQLAAEGITSGCGGGNYCPEQPVTRAQMAVFLLRSKHGASYTPPAVGSGTGFGDVPVDYWAAAWIKQLVSEGITAGCGSGNYCPEQPVTRAQMAVFLVRTFSLP